MNPTPSIPTLPFGATGHHSSRLIFGAAALGRCSQQDADRALETLLSAGINHIDVAASYGDAELRVGPWMARHRDAFFVATKTGERSFAAARDQIHASLERLRIDQLDLIQLHNLVKPDEWETALGPDGALRAALEARDAGQVRFIGVTGHGSRVAQMHLQSLERFAFDSVLLPYNFSMMNSPGYPDDFEALQQVCVQRNVAVQTIKSVARRRWPEGTEPNTTTWYQAFENPDDIERCVHWALARPGVFVNTASDLGLMEHMVRAAQTFGAERADSGLDSLHERSDASPLFIRGFAAGA